MFIAIIAKNVLVVISQSDILTTVVLSIDVASFFEISSQKLENTCFVS
jgi:hypothetical protein